MKKYNNLYKLRGIINVYSAAVWFVGISMPCVLAQEERPKLTIDGPSPHAFTYSRLENGTLYVATYKDVAGREYGAILVWQSGKYGELTDLGTVSSLDKILRSQVDALGVKPERTKIMEMVGPGITSYAQLTSGGYILFPNEIQSFLGQMKAHVPADIYEVLKKRLVYPSRTPQGESWMMPIFILNDDGSIELETFSGSISPFSVMKRETEVLVRSGTIPDKFYCTPTVDD